MFAASMGGADPQRNRSGKPTQAHASAGRPAAAADMAHPAIAAMAAQAAHRIITNQHAPSPGHILQSYMHDPNAQGHNPIVHLLHAISLAGAGQGGGHSIFDALGMFDPRAGAHAMAGDVGHLGAMLQQAGHALDPINYLPGQYGGPGPSNGLSMGNAVRYAKQRNSNGNISIFNQP